MFKTESSKNIMFLDIIHLYLENTVLFIFQLSRFYLKKETESSLRNFVFWKINRTMFLDKDKTNDNVQKKIFLLMYHRHKLLHLIYNLVTL
jgi:hypothetical protein